MIWSLIELIFWTFSGNILISFEPSLMTDMIKTGFLLSIVLSFPLCVLPCRTSLHSLIYGRVFPSHNLNALNLILFNPHSIKSEYYRSTSRLQ